MCYSGKCPYEDTYGECTIRDGVYPDDAGCWGEDDIEDDGVDLEF